MLSLVTNICFLISIGIFLYNASSWFTFANVMAPALEDFSKKNKNFYNSFWGFYPKIKRRSKKNMEKFMLYYLSAREYISIDIDNEKTIRIVNNSTALSKANAVERYLLNRLFGTPNYVEYISEDAIIGKEAVQLKKVVPIYKSGISACDFTSVVKKPVATTDGRRAIDYASIRKEYSRYKKSMWMILLFSFFPSALYEGMIENSVIAIVPSYYLFSLGFFFFVSIAIDNLCDVLHAKADVEPPKDKYTDIPETDDDDSTTETGTPTDANHKKTTENVYIEKTGSFLIVGDESIPFPSNVRSFFKFFSLRTIRYLLKAKNHDILAFFIDVIRFLLWAAVFFFSGVLLIAFLSVTGSEVTQPVAYIGYVMIFISWIVKCVRRSNKRIYFAMRKKNNKSYIKFLKEAFKPAQLSANTSSFKNLTTLIPYSVLMGKEKELQALLPETHESIPEWINAPYEMSFNEIDKLIDAELNYERPIN